MIIAATWIAVAGVGRFLEGTWWTPGALMGLLFAVSAVGTAALAPDYPNSIEANLLLQGLALVLSLAGMLFRRLASTNKRPVSFAVTRLGVFLTVGYSSAIASLAATMAVVGVGPGELLSWNTLAAVVQASTKQRYTVGFSFPLYYNVANAILFAYAVMASTHWVQLRRLDARMLGPLLIYCGSNLLITTRAPLLFMAILMVFSAAFAERVHRPDGRFGGMFSWRHVRRILAIGAAVAGLFFFFQVLRFGESHAQPAGDVWRHLRRYPWGSLPGFSIWREGLAGWTPVHHVGYYTFMGVFDNLGIEPRVEGGFADFVSLAPGEAGNIYTAFRGLILDFGVVGTVFFMFSLGAISGLAVWTSVFPPRIALSVYVAVTGFIAWSLIFSLWAYTSVLVALVLLPALQHALTKPAVASRVGRLVPEGRSFRDV